MKTSILFVCLAFSVVFAQSSQLRNIDRKCSRGNERNMSYCYEIEYRKIEDAIKKKQEEIKYLFQDPSLALETQPIWTKYVEKWCHGRRLSSGDGFQYSVFYNCMIEHSLLRLEQLNLYYCNENGCSATKEVFATSYNCKNVPYESTEWQICTSESLAEKDIEMSDLYAKVQLVYSNNEQLKVDQITWIKKRSSCKTLDCLEDSYQERITYLQNIVSQSNR